MTFPLVWGWIFTSEVIVCLCWYCRGTVLFPPGLWVGFPLGLSIKHLCMHDCKWLWIKVTAKWRILSCSFDELGLDSILKGILKGVVAETPLKDKSLLCSPKTFIFRTLATPTQTNRKWLHRARFCRAWWIKCRDPPLLPSRLVHLDISLWHVRTGIHLTGNDYIHLLGKLL